MSTKIKHTVEVLVCVEVEVDEAAFTPEYMAAFRDCFYNFDSIEDHVRHIASAKVDGIIDEGGGFLEGYGDLADMGIRVRESGREVEVADTEVME